MPVLWVWDNVEPVTGFPAGTPSAWTDDEQAELRAFLRDLGAQTRAKVLLTSRRDEHGWLGDLPRADPAGPDADARAAAADPRPGPSPGPDEPAAGTTSTGVPCCASPAATR